MIVLKVVSVQKYQDFVILVLENLVLGPPAVTLTIDDPEYYDKYAPGDLFDMTLVEKFQLSDPIPEPTPDPIPDPAPSPTPTPTPTPGLDPANRAWYVDSAAVDGGDGSEGAPCNSFEQVAGYWQNGNYITGELRGGDHLYIIGTFYAGQHVEGVKNMTLHLNRGTQGGTIDNPTRIIGVNAVFDGQYVAQDLVKIAALSNDPIESVVISGITVTNAVGRGMFIDDYVLNSEVKSCSFTDTRGNPSLGAGGGLTVAVLRDVRHHSINNCSFSGNYQTQSFSANNNLGGLTILSEPGADPTSSVTVINNAFNDEINAIRHKHSGNIHMSAHSNTFTNIINAFYIRALSNDIFNNIITGCTTAFYAEAESQGGNSDIQLTGNVVNAMKFLDTGNSQTTFARRIAIAENDYIGPPTPSILLGQWSSNKYNLADFVSNGGNTFTTSEPVIVHEGVTLNFADVMHPTDQIV